MNKEYIAHLKAHHSDKLDFLPDGEIRVITESQVDRRVGHTNDPGLRYRLPHEMRARGFSFKDEE